MTTAPLVSSQSDYNYYPRTMIALSEISYQEINIISDSVKSELGLEVVWGPAQLTSDLGITKSLMFVAHRKTKNEYIVVLRGTTLDSWDSWTKEDFAIGPPPVHFNTLATLAPKDACISKGAATGMGYLIGLRDPTTGLDVVAYLGDLENSNLYVTGHSLGGTLAPPMVAYLNERLYGGGLAHNMGLWSFAGLTAGDLGFNSYFGDLFKPGYKWRIHNTLDIAPFCWESLKSIEDIYKFKGLNWWYPEKELLKYLFSEAAPNAYAQPVGGQALPGTFDTRFITDEFWTAQAAHQHQSSTYRRLVDAFFPVV